MIMHIWSNTFLLPSLWDQCPFIFWVCAIVVSNSILKLVSDSIFIFSFIFVLSYIRFQLYSVPILSIFFFFFFI